MGRRFPGRPRPGPGRDPVTTLGSYTVTPAQPTANDEITITAANGAAGIVLHWGVGDWNKPIEAYLPAGSVYHSDNKAARTPFKLNADGKYEVKIGPFNNPAQEVSYISFVTNTGNSWDNNGGNDYKLVIQASSGIDRTYAPEGALSAFISNGRLVVNLPSQESSYHVTLTNIAGAEAMSAEMSASSSVADATVAPGHLHPFCTEPFQPGWCTPSKYPPGNRSIISRNTSDTACREFAARRV